MKNSSKILNCRNIQKNLTFSSVLCPFRGGDEIRSLLMLFCDEIKPPQTVTFFKKIVVVVVKVKMNMSKSYLL